MKSIISCRLPLISYAFPILLFVFLWVSFFSCRSPHSANSGPAIVKAEFTDQVSLEEIEKYITSFEVVPLEYSTGNEMGQISMIAGTKEKVAIYIRRAESIWIADYKGHILTKIAKSGKGPEEYLSVSDMAINPAGNLVLVDVYKRMLLEYSLEGDFIGETAIPDYFETIEYLHQKNPVFGSYRVRDHDDKPGYYIHVHNPDLSPEKQLLPFYTSWTMGGHRPDLTSRGHEIGITKVGDYNYCILNEDFSVDTMLVFDFGANGYDFSNSDRMEFEDFLQIYGQNLAKPISAGFILPQEHNYLALNIFKGLPYSGVGSWDQDVLIYRPINGHKIIGTSKGFPVPNARELVDGKIIGSLEAMDILDFWDQNPDQKVRAEKEPEFRNIIDQLDAEDNPVLIFFKLG